MMWEFDSNEMLMSLTSSGDRGKERECEYLMIQFPKLAHHYPHVLVLPSSPSLLSVHCLVTIFAFHII